MTRTSNNRLQIVLPPVAFAILAWSLVFYIMPTYKKIYADQAFELPQLTLMIFRSPSLILFIIGVLIGGLISVGRIKNEWKNLVPVGVAAYFVYFGLLFFGIFGPALLER